MKKRIIILAAAAAACMAGWSQINEPGPEGCLQRAKAMMADENYIGCTDQLRMAQAMTLSPEQKRQALLLQAQAYTHIDRALAATLLRQYLADYPADPTRAQALLALGDCLYGPEYPQGYAQALEVYDSILPDMLPYDQRCDLAYRQAFCLIEVANAAGPRQSKGELDRAASLLQTLSDSDKYARAAQFYRGYIAYVQGDFARAESLLNPVRSLPAPCNMADFYLAQISYLRGDWSKALSMAKSLLQRPGIPAQYADEAMRLAGESAYRIGNDSEARKYLQMYAASAAEPQPSALYILGLYTYQDGDYAKSVELFAPASAMDDAMGQAANLYIGQALLKGGDADGAAIAFNKAMKQTFDTDVQEAAHYNFAVASLQGGKVPFGNAVASFEEFMSKFPDSQYAPQAQSYVIDSYFSTGNYEGALKSINSMPRPTADTQRAKLMALYRLGASALETGKPMQAIDYLKQAQALARYDAETAREAGLVLGEAQYQSGLYADAAQQAQAYLKSAPASAQNRPVAQVDLGYALFAQKKYQQAAESFRKAVAADGSLSAPVRADASCRLGDCLYYQKNFSSAAEAYDRAYALNPAVGDYALLQKGLMEGYQRNHRSKIAYLERLQDEFPTSPYIPDALLEMTESYIQLGDNSSAIGIYRRLVTKYPGTAQGRQGYLQMALTMLNSGDRQGAIQAYKDVVRLYPTSDEAAQGAEALKRIAADDGWLAEYADFINSVPGAPSLSASEADALEFEAAEKAYITASNPSKLETYVQKSGGAYRAKALSYLLQNALQNSDAQKAYSIASTLAEDYPDNGLALEAYAAKAQIEEEQGKDMLALQSWQALESRASTPYYLNMARVGITRTALATAEYDLAAAAAEQALASTAISREDKALALYALGESLLHKGKATEARKAWAEAAEDLNDINGLRSAFALAQQSFDSGNIDRAEKEAKTVVNSNSPYPYWVARGFILLSDVYAKQGNEYKSQQYLKSLKDNYPGTEADIFEMIDSRLK